MAIGSLAVTPASLGGMAAAGTTGKKSDETNVRQWWGVSQMLVPHGAKHNLLSSTGATRQDGSLKPQAFRNGFQQGRVRVHAARSIGNNEYLAKPHAALVAVQVRDSIEVVDFDRCAKKTYRPVLDALIYNGCVPMLAVESGTPDSLHLYVHRPAGIDHDDFWSWVSEAADPLVWTGSKNDPTGQVVSRKVESATGSSIRLPGSSSLKTRAWAKPVSTFAPFGARRYLTVDDAHRQVRTVLGECGLSALALDEAGEGAGGSSGRRREPVLPPVSATYRAAITPAQVEVFASAGQEVQASSDHTPARGRAIDPSQASLPDHGVIASGDTSLDFLTLLNVLWASGVRGLRGLQDAVRQATGPGVVKPRRKGVKWTEGRIQGFLDQKAAYAAQKRREGGGSGDPLMVSLDEYSRYIGAMRTWCYIAIGEGWPWWLIWTMGNLFQERMADSWDGQDVPVSNRDVRVWTGFGSAKAAKFLTEMVRAGVLVKEESGSHTPGESRATRYSFQYPDSARSRGFRTVVTTGGRGPVPLVTHSGSALPLGHLAWHPRLLTGSGVPQTGHPLLHGGEGTPAWESLLADLDRVRATVFAERKAWYGASHSTVRAMTSVNVVVPAGSPRATLDGRGYWSWVEVVVCGLEEACRLDALELVLESEQVSSGPSQPRAP